MTLGMWQQQVGTICGATACSNALPACFHEIGMQQWMTEHFAFACILQNLANGTDIFQKPAMTAVLYSPGSLLTSHIMCSLCRVCRRLQGGPSRSAGIAQQSCSRCCVHSSQACIKGGLGACTEPQASTGFWCVSNSLGCVQQAEWLLVSHDEQAIPQDCTLILLVHVISPDSRTGS